MLMYFLVSYLIYYRDGPLENHLLDRKHQNALSTELLQTGDDVPEAFFIEHGVHTAPAFLSQRHHGRALGARQHGYHIGHLVGRPVHQHLFLVLGTLHGLDAEKQFVENGALLLRQSLVTNQQGLALHHHFHFLQIVAD